MTTYYLTLAVGACVGIYLLSLLFRGISVVFQRLVKRDLSPVTHRLGSALMATVVAYIVSGYGAADGGPPDWSDSWVYLLAGSIVMAIVLTTTVWRGRGAAANMRDASRATIPIIAVVAVVLGAGLAHWALSGRNRTVVGAFVGLLGDADHVEAMQAGFEQVSGDWEAFAEEWAVASPLRFDSLEKEALVLYSTEPELVDIFQFRSERYAEWADDPERNPACGLEPSVVDLVTVLAELRTDETMRQVGRSLARQHEGYDAWEPPLPLPDEVREAFRRYVVNQGVEEVARVQEALAEDRGVGNADLCRAQGEIYRLAASRPQDRVADLRLFDYIRTIEALALPSVSSRAAGPGG